MATRTQKVSLAVCAVVGALAMLPMSIAESQQFYVVQFPKLTIKHADFAPPWTVTLDLTQNGSPPVSFNLTIEGVTKDDLYARVKQAVIQFAGNLTTAANNLQPPMH